LRTIQGGPRLVESGLQRAYPLFKWSELGRSTVEVALVA
jgi:hypothetical protein